MDDHFRPIEGFPGYRVSRKGEVQSCWLRRGRFCLVTDTWLPLKPIDRLGYSTLNLARGGKKSIRGIHRLVLEAFVGPAPAGHICCHDDGNASNNHLSNLRWDSHKSNSDDTLRHGRRARGTSLSSSLSEADVLEIRRLRIDGLTMNALADCFHVSPSAIKSIVWGRTWRHLLNPKTTLRMGFSHETARSSLYTIMMTFSEFITLQQQTGLSGPPSALQKAGVSLASPNQDDTRRAISRSRKRGVVPTINDLKATISPETHQTAAQAVQPKFPRP